jgi:hypothetical protein
VNEIESISGHDRVPPIVGLCYTCCEGDTIAILYGCRYPVVLRRVEEEAEKYEVIGEVYTHGYMLGEALNESKGVFERKWNIV